MDKFDPCSLFIKKESIVLVTEDQDIETSHLQVAKVVYLQLLTNGRVGQCNQEYEYKDTCDGTELTPCA
jgi:hypothetical protein